MDLTNKKYPKSSQNFQCLGPCYQPGTVVVHPTTLEYVINKEHAFCPVDRWEYVNPKTGQKSFEYKDDCLIPTQNKDNLSKEREIDILVPTIDFNDMRFLAMYYRLTSFEDSLNWIFNNKKTPVSTRMRILNCSFNAYGKNIDILDERLVSFIVEVINKKWIDDLFGSMKKYINVYNDKIQLSEPTVSSPDEEYNDQLNKIKLKYFKSKFINDDEINKFLMKYIKYRSESWGDIIDIGSNIKAELIKYFENKIISTIRK